MNDEVSRRYKGPGDQTPYVPSWINDGNCPKCGAYHDLTKACVLPVEQSFIDAHHNPIVRDLNLQIRELDAENDKLRKALESYVALHGMSVAAKEALEAGELDASNPCDIDALRSEIEKGRQWNQLVNLQLRNMQSLYEELNEAVIGYLEMRVSYEELLPHLTLKGETRPPIIRGGEQQLGEARALLNEACILIEDYSNRTQVGHIATECETVGDRIRAFLKADWHIGLCTRTHNCATDAGPCNGYPRK